MITQVHLDDDAEISAEREIQTPYWMPLELWLLQLNESMLGEV